MMQLFTQIDTGQTKLLMSSYRLFRFVYYFPVTFNRNKYVRSYNILVRQ